MVRLKHIDGSDSKTAFFYAVDHEKTENIKRLKKSHASFTPHLPPDKLEARTVYDAASDFGTTKYLEVLLKSGYCVDATDSDGTTPLHLASKENKEEAIVHLVNHGAIVDILDKNQRTALHHAVLNSNFEATRLLLRNKSKTDLADVDQKTPLYIALELKDQQIVRELLDVGSTIHLENDFKSNVSQVYWAAKNDKKSMVETLHKCGVDMDGVVVVEEGKTPLHLASAEGSEETVQILLENGANVDVYCKKGLSPLFYASCNKHHNVTQRLLNQTKKIHKDCAPEMTHLHWAVRGYYPDVAKTLAGAGLDINGEVYDRSTILHREIRDNELEVIQLCVELEADIHKEDREKRTPLFYAIRNDKVENAKFLLGSHANFLPLSEAASVLQEETGDVPKWSVSQQPIYLAAAKYKEKSFVDNLKKAGKNINDAFQDGLTAIHVAAANNETKAVEILMECGADVNKQDEQGCTPLHHAVVKRNNDVVEVLISNIATTKDAVNKNGKTSLYCAAERSFHDTAKILLRNQCKIHPDAFGTDNNSQLHWALENGHRPVVSVLKDAGVDINSYVQRGMTSLHILSEEGDDRGVEILLDYGADINKFSTEGYTALYYASNGEGENCLNVTKRLLFKDAQVMRENSKDFRLLWAVSECRNKIVENLISAGLDIDKMTILSEDSSAESSVLHSIATRGQHRSVRLCIEVGCKVNLADSNFRTALYYATQSKDVDTVRELRVAGAGFFETENPQTPEKNMQGLDGQKMNIYVAAAKYKDKDMVTILKKAGENIDIKDKDGMTALHHTCSKGLVDAAKILLECGANNFENDKDGKHPLHHAVFGRNNDLVSLICEKSAALDHNDESGKTALHYAAVDCQMEIVENLLRNGANKNSVTKEGHTPLYLVLDDIETDKGKKIRMAHFLLEEYKAKVHGDEDDTLLHYYWAAQNDAENILSALEEAGENINELHMVYNQESTEIDDAQSECAPEEHKCTTLQYAVRECAPLRTLNHLMSKGASANVCDTVGRNALHWAAEHCEGHLKIVRRVCEDIFDVNAVDKVIYCSSSCLLMATFSYII
ncbi:ankyrin-3-like [Ptychodera flava]|uniref:ankyrin-3-like n=1 Tax=Ptychodera flava TaxID=63121 RepID=UPI00396A61A7